MTQSTQISSVFLDNSMRDEVPKAFVNGYAAVVPSQSHLRVLRNLWLTNACLGFCGILRFNSARAQGDQA